MHSAARNPRGAISSLTFFFPYHEVSGVPVLFSRMAMYLSEHCGIDTRVVDYRDGPMAKALTPGTRVTLVPFEDGVDVQIGDDTILVMQSVLPAAMRSELQADAATRVLFWTLHPMNFVQTLVPMQWCRDLQSRSATFHRVLSSVLLRRFTVRLRAYVQTLVDHRSIVFMDGVNLEATCDRVGVSIPDPVFVPVPCEVGGSNPRSHVRGPATPLRVAWVGRLDDFKTHILVYTIKRLSAHAATPGGPSMRFDVVGDGPDAAVVRALDVRHAKFDLVHHGRMPLGDLDGFLLSHVDLLVAMGTSAMEGAKLGIPTVLLDVAYGPITGDYLFRWFFESSQHTLGFLVSRESYRAGNRSLELRVEALGRDYPVLSQQTFDYCRQFHSMNATADRLLAAAAACDFRWGAIGFALRRKGVVRRAYEFTRRTMRPRPQPNAA